MNAIGIIPARGGSKGVSRKNLRLVADQPLITYAIQAAKKSLRLTYFLTTTDSEEIAGVAQEYGSPTVLRPPELARDNTPMLPVVVHALEHAEQVTGSHFDAILLLQPTSPIREGKDLDGVITLLDNDLEVDGIISVCPMDDVHPARMYTLDELGWMNPLWPDWETMRRQRLPVVYYRNGAIYAVRRSVLFDQQTLMPARKKAYIMPRERLANIDDERDLVIADALVRLWQEGRL